MAHQFMRLLLSLVDRFEKLGEFYFLSLFLLLPDFSTSRYSFTSVT